MMQIRDWVSGIIGALIFLLGLAPFLGFFNTDFVTLTIITWIISITGIILLQDSIVEIANSNIIGWTSLIIALVALVIGILPILNGFGIGPSFFGFPWISRTIYNVFFMIEGLFLMIATFAREL